MPKCSWVYQRTSGKYLKGDRCKLPVMNEEFVFCSKHHKQASNNSNACVVNGNCLEKEKYVPTIGLVQCVKTNSISNINMVQGNIDKLTDFLDLPTEKLQLK